MEPSFRSDDEPSSCVVAVSSLLCGDFAALEDDVEVDDLALDALEVAVLDDEDEREDEEEVSEVFSSEEVEELVDDRSAVWLLVALVDGSAE